MEHFSQLSYNERRQIYSELCDGKSQSKIALMLGRDKSTISREIRRNSDHIGYLYPGYAHQKAQDRRNKNKAKLTKNETLKGLVLEKLYKRWSPASIAGSLKNEKSWTISKEAIYQWIYTKEGESLGLKKFLIRARKKRGLKRKVACSKIKNRVSVHTRSEVINQRIEPGHYECDLIFNSGSQSKNICTLVERVSRKAILIHNSNKLTKTVVSAVIEYIKTHNLFVKSITFDNGSEFADHHKLNDLNIETFFCDPGAPWQKGSIENLNGMLRRYLPFSLAAESISDSYVEKVNDQINSIPRAILGYKTPNEAFDKLYKKVEEQESRVKAALPAVEAISYNQNCSGVAFQY